MRENDKLQSDSSFHSCLISSLSHSLSLSLSIIIACQYVFYNSLIKCGVFGDGKEVYDNL